ncbi:MAG: YraN family protein [Christensenellales bacterium]
MNKKIIGDAGENIAAEFLMKNGYKILSRNFRVKGAEIDVIAAKKNLVVFVEVKTRQNLNYGLPSEAVTKAKQRKIAMAAECFIVKNRLEKNDFRFDVIEILGDEINHIENAFYV